MKRDRILLHIFWNDVKNERFAERLIMSGEGHFELSFIPTSERNSWTVPP
jgi:hypothetical protein